MKIRIINKSKHEKADWVSVKKLIETTRGSGGFGHTGKE